MTKSKKIVIFKGQKIRRYWDDEKEKWWFSVVDVIAALTESKNQQVYWRVFKKRLIDEGSNQSVTKCNALKMLAADGEYETTKYAKLAALIM